jgi:hypothetical protein
LTAPNDETLTRSVVVDLVSRETHDTHPSQSNGANGANFSTSLKTAAEWAGINDLYMLLSELEETPVSFPTDPSLRLIPRSDSVVAAGV